jgi:hypothetical protein
MTLVINQFLDQQSLEEEKPSDTVSEKTIEESPP